MTLPLSQSHNFVAPCYLHKMHFYIIKITPDGYNCQFLIFFLCIMLRLSDREDVPPILKKELPLAAPFELLYKIESCIILFLLCYCNDFLQGLYHHCCKSPAVGLVIFAHIHVGVPNSICFILLAAYLNCRYYIEACIFTSF